jgi:PAT family beta-lactamase induction signal transducer AmpG
MVYRYKIMRSLWIAGILQMLTNLFFVLQAYIGYDPSILVLTICAENLAGGMGSAIFVAYISGLCRSGGYAATQYAFLSALASLGRGSLSIVSGLIAEQVGWIIFFLISVIAAIPGLIVLYIINSNSKESATPRD